MGVEGVACNQSHQLLSSPSLKGIHRLAGHAPGGEGHLLHGGKTEMANRLIVEPVGGLTNRLMALTSGLRLANVFNRDFALCWSPAEECGAEFADLFTNDFELVSPAAHDPDFVSYHIGHGATGWNREPTIPPPQDDKDIWLKTHGVITYKGEVRDASFFPSGPVLFDLGRYVRVLRVRDDIRETAETIRFPPNKTIGLHIRRPYNQNVAISSAAHANEQKIYNSISDEYYSQLIGRLLELDRDISFFLSTNSVQTEQALRSLCSAEIFTFSKTGADDTRLASSARDALVDLLLLSDTFGIVRQVDSHFALFAGLATLCTNLVLVRESNSLALVSIRFMENSFIEVDRTDSALKKLIQKNYNFRRH